MVRGCDSVTNPVSRRPPFRHYLDDRPAPDGWPPVRTPEDFRDLVSRYRWAALSFDHDLSAQYNDVAGADLLHWMLDEEASGNRNASSIHSNPRCLAVLIGFVTGLHTVLDRDQPNVTAHMYPQNNTLWSYCAAGDAKIRLGRG
jgi:hypothetical protein